MLDNKSINRYFSVQYRFTTLFEFWIAIIGSAKHGKTRTIYSDTYIHTKMSNTYLLKELCHDKYFFGENYLLFGRNQRK